MVVAVRRGRHLPASRPDGLRDNAPHRSGCFVCAAVVSATEFGSDGSGKVMATGAVQECFRRRTRRAGHRDRTFPAEVDARARPAYPGARSAECNPDQWNHRGVAPSCRPHVINGAIYLMHMAVPPSRSRRLPGLRIQPRMRSGKSVQKLAFSELPPCSPMPCHGDGDGIAVRADSMQWVTSAGGSPTRGVCLVRPGRLRAVDYAVPVRSHQACG